MSLYLDASAIVPTLVEEASSGAVGRFLADSEDQWVVGGLAAIEVTSALSRLVRMKLMAQDKGLELLTNFDQWRAMHTVTGEIGAGDFPLADLFVRRFDLALRAPDALHLAACRRGDHTLVTLDRRLAGAAEALGVGVSFLG
ncbi:MAG: type II toxin-antitoxin system VapC family toxin [Caulobacteraceae bacterium]